MHRTAATLLRWEASFPGTPMPNSSKELSTAQRLTLADNDKELLSLLDGTASAALEASVLTGEFSATRPDPAAAAAAAVKAEVEQLIAEGAFPKPGYYDADGKYVEPVSGDLTKALRISQLDPARYELESQRSKLPSAEPGALSEQGADFVNARLASLNAGGAI